MVDSSARRTQISGVLGCCLSMIMMLPGCAADPRPAEPSRPGGWHQTHVVDPPSGWLVTARSAGPTGESTSLTGPDGSGCLVSTWATEPASLWWPVRSTAAVEVQGLAATYGDLDPEYGPYGRAVIWQDAEAQWFRVSCDAGRSTVLAVAEHVHAGVNPMRLPFTLSAMPAGMTLKAVIETADGADHVGAVQFEMPGPGRPLVMEIANVTEPWYATGPLERRTFAGRPAEIRPATQTICFPTRSEPICIQGPGDEPATDWMPTAQRAAWATADLLTPSVDPRDQASWVDADAAIPG